MISGYLQPRKQENLIGARFGPFWGFDPFRGTKII